MNTTTNLAFEKRTGFDPIFYALPKAVSARRRRALLAEDDIEFRALIAHSLTKVGFSVKECSTGLELVEALDDGLTHADRYPVDVVVTDIRMPGYTGLEVLDGLRELNDRIPVVLMTAFTDEDAEQEAARLRASAVFYKPFDVDELVQTVRACLAPGV